MIKKRIKDGSYDDVLRKKQDEKKVRKVVELDQKKSKVGLAEIYEKEVFSRAFFPANLCVFLVYERSFWN
jgi:U3 small nucleolar ribonucleoprotein component